MRNDRERLLDILEAIERIHRYTGLGVEAFEKNELIQNWVVRHIQIIGEATAKLSLAFRAKHHEVPWDMIVGMRNIIVHDYFNIDLDVVKGVLEKDLPILKPQIVSLLDELSAASPESGSPSRPSG